MAEEPPGEATAVSESGAPASAMRRFRYRASEPVTGVRRDGEMAAESAFAVRASLRRIGLRPEAVTVIDESGVPPWAVPLRDAWHAHLRRRRQSSTADLTQAVATLLHAGVTLDEALATIAGSPTRSPAERALTGRLREAVRDGRPLSDACAAEPAWFDRFDVALIAAGQRAGDLPATLRASAAHHQRSGSIGQRLFVALAYPGVLTLAGFGVLVFMGEKILPQLTALLQQSHQPVPPLTTLVMDIGRSAVWWWPLLIILPLGATLGLRWLAERTPAAGRLGQLVHGNPLARLRRRYRAGRFAWALARLLGAGMTVTEALAVVADTLHDRALRRLVTDALAAITRGEDFSASVARSTLLDPEVAYLIRVGERSGELPSMLEQVAEHSFQSADTALDRVTALLGPLAIVILAGLIGAVVLACVLPLSHLGDAL